MREKDLSVINHLKGIAEYLPLPEESKNAILSTFDTLTGTAVEPQIVDVETAARIAKVCPQTVKRWIRTGKLKNYSKGKKYLVRKDDLLMQK